MLILALAFISLSPLVVFGASVPWRIGAVKTEGKTPAEIVWSVLTVYSLVTPALHKASLEQVRSLLAYPEHFRNVYFRYLAVEIDEAALSDIVKCGPIILRLLDRLGIINNVKADTVIKLREYFENPLADPFLPFKCDKDDKRANALFAEYDLCRQNSVLYDHPELFAVIIEAFMTDLMFHMPPGCVATDYYKQLNPVFFSKKPHPLSKFVGGLTACMLVLFAWCFISYRGNREAEQRRKGWEDRRKGWEDRKNKAVSESQEKSEKEDATPAEPAKDKEPESGSV